MFVCDAGTARFVSLRSWMDASGALIHVIMLSVWVVEVTDNDCSASGE